MKNKRLKRIAAVTAGAVLTAAIVTSKKRKTILQSDLQSLNARMARNAFSQQVWSGNNPYYDDTTIYFR
jgi:glutamine amidotransferase PdxT